MTSSRKDRKTWSLARRTLLCVLLALAAAPCSLAQQGTFSELPPVAAPEVSAPAPSGVLQSKLAAAPAEILVPAASAPVEIVVPAAAPSEVTVPGGTAAELLVQAAAPTPAAVPAAAPAPSQELPVYYVCWPFNTYIQPGDNYTVDIQAEDVVLDAMTFNVTNDGTLQLSTEGNFRSPYLVVAIVSLPFDALSGVFVPSPSAEVTVGPGFVASNFTASAPYSSQNLNVLGLMAETLRVQSSGLGQIYVDGIVGNASVAASGLGDIYIVGLEDTAILNLAGTATVTIQAANESVAISGQATGINTVLYDNGSCFVTTPFLYGSPCQQTDLLSLPTIDPLWTCGLRVIGNFNCPAGGIQQAQTEAIAGLLPLAAATVRPSPPVVVRKPVPSPSPTLPPPSPSPPIVTPPVVPLLSTLAAQPPPPAVFPSPSPNIVSSVGSGPQFAGASGTGTQVANAVSSPGLQQQSTGTSSPIPDLFNTPGFTDGGFSNFSGKRRLSQAMAGSSATSFGNSGSDASGVLRPALASAAKTTRPFPCYYDVLNGFDTLHILPDGAFYG
ncbi:g9899 [Coccomyxa elongata]